MVFRALTPSNVRQKKCEVLESCTLHVAIHKQVEDNQEWSLFESESVDAAIETSGLIQRKKDKRRRSNSASLGASPAFTT